MNLINRVLPNAPTPDNECGLVRYGRLTKTDAWDALTKVDYQLSNSHSIFGRYLAASTVTPGGYQLTPDNILNSTVIGNDQLSQSFAFGSTYLLGPNMVNAFRFAANRTLTLQEGSRFFSICDLGGNYYCGYAPERIWLSVTNGPSIGSSYNGNPPARFYQSGFAISDDFSLVRGAHQMTFGGNISWGLLDGKYVSLSPRLVVNGAVTGAGLADLLTGRLAQMRMQGPNDTHSRVPQQTLYAADTWKATSELTLSFGLRWEPYIPMTMLSGRGVANFSYERFRQGIKSTVYANPPVGWYYPGDPGYPGPRGSYSGWANFAPRFGFAWDVEGNGRTSVRASVAYAYSPVLGNWREGYSSTNPWGNATRLLNPPGGLDDPWLGYPGGNPFPQISGKGFTQDGDYISTPYEMQTPQTASWNLSVQRQIGSDWLVSASYIGNTSSHIWIQDTGNPALFLGLAPCTLNGVTFNPCSQASADSYLARRLFSLERPGDAIKMGNVAFLEDTGTMNYHGLITSVQRQAGRNISVNANYTWSHCVGDDVDLTASGPDAGATFGMPGNRTFDRGDCTGDRRQIFNLTSVATMPEFANPTVRLLASGWSLSGIYRRSSGQPLNVLAGSDRVLNGVQSSFSGATTQRGNQISGEVYADASGRMFTNWLNRAAYDLPALGTLGNIGRNNVVGPTNWSFDMALARSFRFREAQRFEFRAEAFNVTNSYRPGNPAAGLNSTNFGQIRTALSPRILQFALKYVF
jgi:hypothetical protein